MLNFNVSRNLLRENLIASITMTTLENEIILEIEFPAVKRGRREKKVGNKIKLATKNLGKFETISLETFFHFLNCFHQNKSFLFLHIN